MTSSSSSQTSCTWTAVWPQAQKDSACFASGPWSQESLTVVVFDLAEPHAQRQDAFRRLEQVRTSIAQDPERLDHHFLFLAVGNCMYWFDPLDTSRAVLLGPTSSELGPDQSSRFHVSHTDKERICQQCFRSKFTQLKPGFTTGDLDKTLQNIARSDASEFELQTDEERMAGVWYASLYIASLINGPQDVLFASMSVLAFVGEGTVATNLSSPSVQRRRADADANKADAQTPKPEAKTSWAHIAHRTAERLAQDKHVKTRASKLVHWLSEIRWLWAYSIRPGTLMQEDPASFPALFKGTQQLAQVGHGSSFLLPRCPQDPPYLWPQAVLTAIATVPVWRVAVNAEHAGTYTHGTAVVKEALDCTLHAPYIHERGYHGGSYPTQHVRLDGAQLATPHTAAEDIQCPVHVYDQAKSAWLAYSYLCDTEQRRLRTWKQFARTMETDAPCADVDAKPTQALLPLWRNVRTRLRRLAEADKIATKSKAPSKIIATLDPDVWATQEGYAQNIRSMDAVECALKTQVFLWNVYHHGEWAYTMDLDKAHLYTKAVPSKVGGGRVVSVFHRHGQDALTLDLREHIVYTIMEDLRFGLTKRRNTDPLHLSGMVLAVRGALSDIQAVEHLTAPAADPEDATPLWTRVQTWWLLRNDAWRQEWSDAASHRLRHGTRKAIEHQRAQVWERWPELRKDADALQLLFLPVLPARVHIIGAANTRENMATLLHMEWMTVFRRGNAQLGHAFSPSCVMLWYLRMFVTLWQQNAFAHASHFLKMIMYFICAFQTTVIPIERGQLRMWLAPFSAHEQDVLLDLFGLLYVVTLGLFSASQQYSQIAREYSHARLFKQLYNRDPADGELDKWTQQMKEAARTCTSPHDASDELKAWLRAEDEKDREGYEYAYLYTSMFVKNIDPAWHVERSILLCQHMVDEKQKKDTDASYEMTQPPSLEKLRQTYGDAPAHYVDVARWCLMVWMFPPTTLDGDSPQEQRDIAQELRDKYTTQQDDMSKQHVLQGDLARADGEAAPADVAAAAANNNNNNNNDDDADAPETSSAKEATTKFRWAANVDDTAADPFQLSDLSFARYLERKATAGTDQCLAFVEALSERALRAPTPSGAAHPPPPPPTTTTTTSTAPRQSG